jgi:hypothetical protein
VAFIVLAHRDAEQVSRLIRALNGADVFLHCDRRTPDDVLDRMVAGSGPRVRLVPRCRTHLHSWSLVEAELAGLAQALERSSAEHLLVVSGSCYPLMSMPELEDELAGWRGLSRIQLNPLPYDRWDTLRNPNGGYWRFDRRFVTFRGQVLTARGIPLRTWRRRVPRGLRLHASSQWKVYARHHAAALLGVLNDEPEQLRFWRTTLVPDESCAASILSSPALVASISEQLRNDSPWYVKWPADRPTGHPSWLEESDLPSLLAARAAPPRDCEVAVSRAERDRYRKLFARKLRSRASGLLDRIDHELRELPAS